MPPAFFFLSQDCISYYVLLSFHPNFRIVLSISVKNAIGILIEIALNLYVALGSMDTLTILILLIHECRICFHLFVSSSISFAIVLQFSV